MFRESPKQAIRLIMTILAVTALGNLSSDIAAYSTRAGLLQAKWKDTRVVYYSVDPALEPVMNSELLSKSNLCVEMLGCPAKEPDFPHFWPQEQPRTAVQRHILRTNQCCQVHNTL
jgi:hypothetical protein